MRLTDAQLPLVGLICDAAETIEELEARLIQTTAERDKLEAERDMLLDRAHEAQVDRDCARAERDAALDEICARCLTVPCVGEECERWRGRETPKKC